MCCLLPHNTYLNVSDFLCGVILVSSEHTIITVPPNNIPWLNPRILYHTVLYTECIVQYGQSCTVYSPDLICDIDLKARSSSSLYTSQGGLSGM